MMNSQASPTLLIVAHPGHELRVHGWMESERPEVLVLTDGSGSAGVSRLAATEEVLRRAKCRPGPVFGPFSDRELYAVLLEGRIEPLVALAREVAEVLVERRARRVAGDAIEGFNPSHDLCRVLIDAAVSIASRRLGSTIANYDFLLEGSPTHDGDGSIRLELGDEALERKLAASRAYSELAHEVDRALERHGEGAFRIECLRPADPEAELESLVEDPPYYERYGEGQVAAGRYQQVLRFREHFLPLARTLREVGRTGG